MFSINELIDVLGQLAKVTLEPKQNKQGRYWLVHLTDLELDADADQIKKCQPFAVSLADDLLTWTRRIEFKLHTQGIHQEFLGQLGDPDQYRNAAAIYADFLEEQGDTGDCWRAIAESPLRLRRIDESLAISLPHFLNFGERFAWWSPERDTKAMGWISSSPKFGFGSLAEAVCWQAQRLRQVLPCHLPATSTASKYWHWKVFYEWCGYADPNAAICDRHPEVYYAAAKEIGIEHAPTPEFRSRALARRTL